MKKIVISVLALALLVAPAVALAQFGSPQPNTTYINSWVDQLILWTQRAVTFLMVLATIYFIWAVIKYITDKGDKPENVAVKRGAMLRGIIGLAVIVGVWGIVRILTSVFGVSTGGSFDPACPPGQVWSPMERICR